MRKKRKEKDQGRQEGGSAKARKKKFLFWFTSIWVLRDPSRLNIGSYETKSTRKPCAKEVPEMDYLTQQEQYLNRTTLQRLKILLRSFCSKECCTIALERSVSKKAVI